MKQGLYKIIGYDDKGQELMEFNNMKVGEIIEVTKTTNRYCQCELCGRIEKQMFTITGGEYGTEFDIGSSCIKHLQLELVK